MTVRKKAARLLGTSDPCPTQPFLPRRSAGPIRWSASERQSKDGAGHSAETTPLRGEAGRQVGGDWCASRCLVGHASSGPLCYLGVWGNPCVARTVLTPGLGGRRDEMAAEVLSSAKWLYCGEPDESQRAVLGKDCGAGTEFLITSAPVSVPLQPSRPPAGPLSQPRQEPPPPPAPSFVHHYLELGQGSSVIPPRFCRYLPP